MRVCVIGGGGQLAEAVSAWIETQGHEVVHYRPSPLKVPGVPVRPARPTARLEKFITSPEPHAATDGRTGRYRWITRREAARADTFLYCLPSYLAELVGAQLATATNGKHLVNLSDRFMGTVAFSRAAVNVLPQWRCSPAVAFNSPPTLAYQRRRNTMTSVIYTKPFVVAAPTEPDALRDALELIEALFGIAEIRWYPTTLHLAFENINSIVHAVQDLECLKRGLFESPGSLYDAETYTAGIVKRINQVTHDRDAVARRYSQHRFRSLRDFDGSIFRTSSQYSPGTPRYRHHHPLLSTVPRPSVYTAHGYEDVGWSMVPVESAGRMAGVATPSLSALIDDWNLYMGVDYRLIGRSARSLGLNALDIVGG
jgi:hypothetical protein